MIKKLFIVLVAYVTFPLAMLGFTFGTGLNPIYGLLSFIAVVFVLQQFERRKLPEDVTFVDWVSEKVFG
jgi:hypothetical protein